MHRPRVPAAWLLFFLLAAPVAWAERQAPQAVQTAPVADVARGDQLQLRWERLPARASDGAARARSQARLVLANRDNRPLPAQGWSLYFNSIDAISGGPAPGALVLEPMAGSLVRLRPGPGFEGLAPGASLDIPLAYPGRVILLSKAPAGPYLVYDAQPGTGTAITDFQLLPVAALSVTPEDTYRRNARADLLAPGAVPPVLPTPKQLQRGPGKLPIAARPLVEAPAALANEAALARSLFPANLSAGGPALRLAIGRVPGETSPEAYRLRVQPGRGIEIVGNGAAGVSYALQTLRELLPLPGAAWRGPTEPALPEITIVDAPRFAYRGFQLDVARNFHGKETVFKWLDTMARAKMNRFHFHLTDDEGWRLEIPGLPELTAIGAVRGHSAAPGLRLQPAYGSGPDPRDAHGSGYFTRADYIEILHYAKARHIEVIPELEMPGHARAAVQAMRARYERLKALGAKDAAEYLLDDAGDRSVYRSAQYYTDNVIDPGLDSTFAFIEHVVTQVAAMHREAGVPLQTLHMGGDELPNGAWAASPASRARMDREKLADTAALWDYFYGRVDAILRKQGLAVSGWEEIAARRVGGKGPLVPNPRFLKRGFTAWVWNNTEGAEDLAYRLANAGYDIVLAPVSNLYLDMAHNPNPDEPGVNWNDYVELDKVYDFRPFGMLKDAGGKEALSAAGRARVRGLEATLFTESLRDPARIDTLLMPRLLAVAERAWAPDPAWATEADPARAEALHRAAWSGFVNALGQRVLPRLDLDRPVLAYRIAPPGLLVEGGKVLVNHVLPGMLLRYTVDGSEPTAASPLVDGPIAARGLIRVAAFDRRGRRGSPAQVDLR